LRDERRRFPLNVAMASKTPSPKIEQPFGFTRKSMAKSQPLTAEALVKLGPDRLAALLLDAAEHDAALARTLRVAVASQAGAASAAAEIDAEIKRLKRGTSFIDRHRVPDFVRGLSALHDAIVGPLADADPEMALERIFDFIDLAPALIERTDDEGQIADVMRSACADAAALAARASPTFSSERSAFRAYQTYLCDDYGVADHIIAEFAQALDATARAALREWIEGDLARLPPPGEPGSTSAPRGVWKLIFALAQIADAEGDVDAYCAAQQRLGPRVRDDAGMAKRLLDAGRAAEALAVIDAAEPNPAKNAIALADLQIAALTALDRHDEAQTLRWTEFTRGLREEPLRDLLRRMPDFTDVAREQEAMAFAEAYPDPHRALEFLVHWPDIQRAARLIEDRQAALDGNCYWILAPAAEKLEAKAPLAATLLFRKMIEFTLDQGRSSRYGHAARHLHSCAWLAQQIGDWRGHASHSDYVAALRRRHGRKSGFWGRLAKGDSL
jgi:Family of unknown function (DUF6880)